MALTPIEKRKVYAEGIKFMVLSREQTLAHRERMKALYPDIPALMINSRWKPVLDAFDAQIAALRADRDAVVVTNADKVAFADLALAEANGL